ncbi:MAG: hypothetical protein CMJ48_05825 [Planctomycetaceae bacterium]|nr:hypothetical protein [Planctomycetaceae bacterium]
MFRFKQFTMLRLAYLLTAATLLLTSLGTAQAQDALKTDTSLSIVPDDASFYASSLRNKEKLDAFLASKAYAKLKSLPYVQMGLMTLDAQLNDPFGPLADEENKAALAMLGDMFSNEIFVYGDSGFGDLLTLVRKLQMANTAAGIRSAIAGGTDADVAAGLVKAATDNLSLMKVPTTVIGFRLTDADRAKGQLARLEPILKMLLAQQPGLDERFKKTTVGESEFLTLNLDGALIPWEELENDPDVDLEAVRADYDKIKAHVTQMKLTISLGVHEDLLLLTFSPNAELISSLGNGKLLYDRKELAPLRKHAQERISSISYVSEKFADQAGALDQQIDSMLAIAKGALPQLPADDETRAEIEKDLDAAKDSLIELLPEPGALLTFEYITDSGFEGYSYSYAENKLLDGSKPLSLLDHVGGSPIGFSLGRSKYSPKTFDAMVKVLDRVVYHAEKIALPQASDQDRETYEKVSKLVKPLLNRAGETTKNSLLPGFKDGQTALVFDARIKSNQWFAGMPPIPGPLPMFELGCVLGVSDASLVRKAFSEYHAIAQELIDGMHEIDPDQVPQIKLPTPEGERVASGTMYKLDLPIEWGVDEQIAPNAALSEKVAVLSLSPVTTERLLTPTPLALRTGPLADRSRSLAGAGYFNSPALVDAVDAWLQSGIKMFGPLLAMGLAGPGGDPGQDPLAPILEQYNTVVSVIKCYKGYSSATYIENGVTVTHHASVYQDLDE